MELHIPMSMVNRWGLASDGRRKRRIHRGTVNDMDPVGVDRQMAKILGSAVWEIR